MKFPALTVGALVGVVFLLAAGIPVSPAIALWIAMCLVFDIWFGRMQK